MRKDLYEKYNDIREHQIIYSSEFDLFESMYHLYKALDKTDNEYEINKIIRTLLEWGDFKYQKDDTTVSDIFRNQFSQEEIMELIKNEARPYQSNPDIFDIDMMLNIIWGDPDWD